MFFYSVYIYNIGKKLFSNKKKTIVLCFEDLTKHTAEHVKEKPKGSI